LLSGLKKLAVPGMRHFNLPPSVKLQDFLSKNYRKEEAKVGSLIRIDIVIIISILTLIEQYEFIRRVESLFKLADSVEKRVAAASVRAEKLTQSILAKAFRGELVATEAELARREGRSYEPASTLLARIKAERESKRASRRSFSSKNPT
jgi:biopolymer transport protein ExbB/TolQ